uniref:L1 transposable element RRM domain-containing protein n=1 Tax=Micrurus lemniscatus lemniscatus TaxID=129467 RepID=A0A2D4HAE2_MICLE
MEDSLVYLEMDKAAAYLRFQNIVESKEEDLEQVMTEILAEVLERDKDDILEELDEVYRVSTNYVRRHKCPKEVHVRFARRKVQDIIYKISREETIKYKDEEIFVLKQIPKRVREARRDYKSLAAQLNQKGIMFKWLVPEGMLITWGGEGKLK